MTEEQSPQIDRRKFLSTAAVGGAAVVGGVVGAGATALATGGGGWQRESLVIEVACRGDRWRQSQLELAWDDSDFHRGFSVEGWMYPEGTLPESGFVPTPDGAIGEWFCRGWQLIDGFRAAPHVITHQEYLFGLIMPERLFPPDSLTSSGLEGANEESWVAPRSVIGGTGQYMGATGQVSQQFMGENTTVFFGDEEFNALNFRFEFDLLLPNI